jgi:hypothetical protein
MTQAAQPIEAQPSVQPNGLGQRSPTMIEGQGDGQVCKPTPTSRVSTVTRRVRFVARFIYWTWRHGSPKHAAWVCNYEGLWW